MNPVTLAAKSNKEALIKKLLIVGNPEEQHVGAHLLAAAEHLGLEARLFDVRAAHDTNIWVNRFFHRVLKKRPAHLGRFSEALVEACRKFQPELLLVTGIAAPHAAALQTIGAMGIHRANFLTDDPWNSANGAGFFWSALPAYDTVWSPRRANVEELRRHGCRRVEFLAFGYNPKLHFPEAPATAAERERFACEVAFVGGADADRLPVARALVRAGLKVRFYGGYWDRDAELQPHWRGFVLGRELRLAVGGAIVNICLGRKANRDGHAMRSLELPAMGACLVVEDTPEHQELFGVNGDCVEYYAGLEELVAKTRILCRDPARARKLGEKAHQQVCQVHCHTYADRLTLICQTI